MMQKYFFVIFILPVIGDLPEYMRMAKTFRVKCLVMNKELACSRTINCTNATSEEFRKVFRECRGLGQGRC